jgi:orotate phosphoribosyltransferase
MTPQECARLLTSCGAVEIRADPDDWFTWSSGKRAPIYCDNRILLGYPEVRAQIADAFAELIREHHATAEVIAGTSTAGIPHAAWVAERVELPMVYVRGSAKGHGRKKLVEGRPLGGESVVLIEDTISLGGSSASAVEGLVSEGGKVVGVLAIFTYAFPTAVRRLDALGVPVHTLTSYEALVDTLNLDAPTRDLLLKWRQDFD